MAAVGILHIHLLALLTICLVERLARLSWSTLVQSNLSPVGLFRTPARTIYPLVEIMVRTGLSAP